MIPESLSPFANRLWQSTLFAGFVGKFDLGELRWTGEGYKPSATPVVNPENGEEQRPSDAPSLFAAVQEQLGLKLESAKGPVEALVVDRAQKATGN